MSAASERRQLSRRRMGMLIYGVLGSFLGALILFWLWHRAGEDLRGADLALVLPVLLWVVPWFIVPIAAAAAAWCALFPRRHSPPFFPALLLTWIGLGVNWLLPVAMIGGEAVKVRMALRWDWAPYPLLASLVGDKTVQVATQGLYTLLGLSLLVWLSGSLEGIPESLAGLSLFAVAVYLFYRLQQGGLFSGLALKLARFSRDQQAVRLRAARIDAVLRSMYRRRGRWWASVAWRMAFRLLMAVEVLLVLWWLGDPVGPLQAVTLESLAQGARAAAFFIPAGLGAQEAGLLAAGVVLGVPAEVLLLLAVIKRLRELAVGGLAILLWQWHEGHWWWQRRRVEAQ